MNNIKFQYLYRDGSNYKKWGDIVFPNESGLKIEAVTSILCKLFLEDGLFIAHQIRVPEVFLTPEYPLSSDDHCYHEFSSIEATTEATNDAYRRSIQEFIGEIEREAGRGWCAFDPANH